MKTLLNKRSITYLITLITISTCLFFLSCNNTVRSIGEDETTGVATMKVKINENRLLIQNIDSLKLAKLVFECSATDYPLYSKIISLESITKSTDFTVHLYLAPATWTCNANVFDSTSTVTHTATRTFDIKLQEVSIIETNLLPVLNELINTLQFSHFTGATRFTIQMDTTTVCQHEIPVTYHEDLYPLECAHIKNENKNLKVYVYGGLNGSTLLYSDTTSLMISQNASDMYSFVLNQTTVEQHINLTYLYISVSENNLIISPYKPIQSDESSNISSSTSDSAISSSVISSNSLSSSNPSGLPGSSSTPDNTMSSSSNVTHTSSFSSAINVSSSSSIISSSSAPLPDSIAYMVRVYKSITENYQTRAYRENTYPFCYNQKNYPSTFAGCTYHSDTDYGNDGSCGGGGGYNDDTAQWFARYQCPLTDKVETYSITDTITGYLDPKTHNSDGTSLEIGKVFETPLSLRFNSNNHSGNADNWVDYTNTSVDYAITVVVDNPDLAVFFSSPFGSDTTSDHSGSVQLYYK